MNPGKFQNSLILVAISNSWESSIPLQHRPEDSLRYFENLNTSLSRALEAAGAEFETDLRLVRAIWSMETNPLDAISSALKTALALDNSCHDFNRWADSEELPQIRFSIGVDSGRVLLGGSQPLGVVMNSVHAYAEEAAKADCLLVISSELLLLKFKKCSKSIQQQFKKKILPSWDKDVVYLHAPEIAALLG